MAYRIVVDAGHGGDDPGAVSGTLREKDFNLQAANYMYKRFRELGIPVYITRSTDETVDRRTRLDRINNAFGNDPEVILLSNHINAGGGEGAEVVYALRNSDKLAQSVLDEIGNNGQQKRRIYQRRLPEDPSKDYYFIMRETGKITPLLIEYGFIDNNRDASKLQNNLLDYVEGVVKAVTEYTGNKYIEPGGNNNIEEKYIVKRGDTLYSISREFGITIAKIKELNNLTSNLLTVGQVLKLTESGSNSSDASTYVVKNGDTLYKIAKNFNTTVKELIDLNGLTSTVLKIGQTLKIPKEEVEESTVYIVKAGDSLYKIAREFNVSIDDIIKLNNLTNTTLQIGDQLLIPSISAPPIEEPDNNYSFYTVLKGDTLYKIASMYNISVDELKKINNLTNNVLSIGQVLKVPSSFISDEIEYIVKSGDTLYQIAETYHTSVDEIKRLNNLDSNILRIGQILIIRK